MQIRPCYAIFSSSFIHVHGCQSRVGWHWHRHWCGYLVCCAPSSVLPLHYIHFSSKFLRSRDVLSCLLRFAGVVSPRLQAQAGSASLIPTIADALPFTFSPQVIFMDVSIDSRYSSCLQSPGQLRGKHSYDDQITQADGPMGPEHKFVFGSEKSKK